MKTLLLFIIWMNCFISMSAAQDMEQFFHNMKHRQYDLAKEFLDKEKDFEVKYQLNIFYKMFKNIDFSDSIPEIYSDDRPVIKNLKLLNQGILVYLQKGNQPKANEILKKSIKLAKDRGDNILLCESLKFTLEIYQRLDAIVEDNSYIYILKEYEKHLYDKYEKDNHLLKSIILPERSKLNNESEVIKLYFDNKTKLDNITDKFLKEQYNVRWAHFERNYLKNNKESERIIKKSIKELEQLSIGLFEKEQLESAWMNLAITYTKKEEYKKALSILKDLRLDESKPIFRRLTAYKKFWISESYKGLEQIELGKTYYISHLEQILLDDNAYQVSKLSIEQSKLSLEETENELLEEQGKNKQQRVIAIALIGLVLVVGSIGFLLQKNAKRKQLLAEKGKALEVQKLATVLKEQELKSIDAMIAGQEKERQRIANDLHDDLGSLMANVKLHFDALKDNPSPELYSKANTLIETAYHKIRGMAHAKNSGVMANKGLLKAIHEIANSNSIANKLNIQVVDYGLEQQLENSLELTIFRIIQELIANIIKHADATEATIHITNHEDTINVMVEDNGKGFDTKTISKHQGMGIHSIDKRIENLGGTVTIESEINKGTTVIIDIPTL